MSAAADDDAKSRGVHVSVGTANVGLGGTFLKEETHFHFDRKGARKLFPYDAYVARLRAGFTRYLLSDHLPYVEPGVDDDTHPDNVLRNVLAAAGDRGRCLVGVGGVGKSRLSMEVATRAHARGWHVLHVPSMPAEAPLTEDEILDALGEAPEHSRGVLIVFDYLDQLQLSNALLRGVLATANEQGLRLALLGNSRPGHNEKPSSLFSPIALNPSTDQRLRISTALLEATAPTAKARIGLERLRGLCGVRPFIALIMAQNIERACRKPGALEELDQLRPGQLLEWLEKRFFAQGMRRKSDADGKPLQVVSSLLVNAAAAAAVPQTRAAVEQAVEAALRAVGEAPALDEISWQVERLVRFGWLEDQGDQLHAAHDVVVDFMLEEYAIIDGLHVPRFVEHVLAGGAVSARTLGRMCLSFRRLARNGYPEARRMAESAATWVARNATRIRDLLLLTPPDEAAYAMGSLLFEEPFLGTAIRSWTILIDPWLRRHRSHASARHVLHVALRSLPDGSADAAITAALRWLLNQDRRDSVPPVLGPLLQRTDLRAAERSEALWLAFKWLDGCQEVADAHFVLLPMLTARDLHRDEPEAVAQAAIKWVSTRLSQRPASLVLRALLSRPHVDNVSPTLLDWCEARRTDPGANHLFEECLKARALDGRRRQALVQYALTWLELHSHLIDASYVLHAVFLQRELDKHVADRCCALSRTWLGSHGSSGNADRVLWGLLRVSSGPILTEARTRALELIPANALLLRHSYLINAIIGRTLDWPGCERGIELAMRWLGQFGEVPEARFVLQVALSRGKLAGYEGVFKARACQWLEVHRETLEAEIVLSVLLERDDLTSAERQTTLAEAVDWLDARAREATARVDSSFLLRATLQAVADEDLATAQPLMTRALDWLRGHARVDYASYVLIPLAKVAMAHSTHLQATRDAVDSWLGQFGGTLGASHVLSVALAYPRDHRSDTLRRAFEWLGIFGRSAEASFVLKPLLDGAEMNVADSVAALTAALEYLHARPRSGPSDDFVRNAARRCRERVAALLAAPEGLDATARYFASLGARGRADSSADAPSASAGVAACLGVLAGLGEGDRKPLLDALESSLPHIDSASAAIYLAGGTLVGVFDDWPEPAMRPHARWPALAPILEVTAARLHSHRHLHELIGALTPRSSADIARHLETMGRTAIDDEEMSSRLILALLERALVELEAQQERILREVESALLKRSARREAIDLRIIEFLERPRSQQRRRTSINRWKALGERAEMSGYRECFQLIRLIRRSHIWPVLDSLEAWVCGATSPSSGEIDRMLAEIGSQATRAPLMASYAVPSLLAIASRTPPSARPPLLDSAARILTDPMILPRHRLGITSAVADLIGQGRLLDRSGLAQYASAVGYSALGALLDEAAEALTFQELRALARRRTHLAGDQLSDLMQSVRPLQVSPNTASLAVVPLLVLASRALEGDDGQLLGLAAHALDRARPVGVRRRRLRDELAIVIGRNDLADYTKLITKARDLRLDAIARLFHADIRNALHRLSAQKSFDADDLSYIRGITQLVVAKSVTAAAYVIAPLLAVASYAPAVDRHTMLETVFDIPQSAAMTPRLLQRVAMATWNMRDRIRGAARLEHWLRMTGYHDLAELLDPKGDRFKAVVRQLDVAARSPNEPLSPEDLGRLDVLLSRLVPRARHSTYLASVAVAPLWVLASRLPTRREAIVTITADFLTRFELPPWERAELENQIIARKPYFADRPAFGAVLVDAGLGEWAGQLERDQSDWHRIEHSLGEMAANPEAVMTEQSLSDALAVVRSQADDSPRSAAHVVVPLLALASRMPAGTETDVLETVLYILRRPTLGRDTIGGIRAAIQRSTVRFDRNVLALRLQERRLSDLSELLDAEARQFKGLLRRLGEIAEDPTRPGSDEDFATIDSVVLTLRMRAAYDTGSCVRSVAPLLVAASRSRQSRQSILTLVTELLRSPALSAEARREVADRVNECKTAFRDRPDFERELAEQGYVEIERLCRTPLSQWRRFQARLDELAAEAQGVPDKAETRAATREVLARADVSPAAASHTVVPLLILASRMAPEANKEFLDAATYVVTHPDLPHQSLIRTAYDVARRRKLFSEPEAFECALCAREYFDLAELFDAEGSEFRALCDRVEALADGAEAEFRDAQRLAGVLVNRVVPRARYRPELASIPVPMLLVLAARLPAKERLPFLRAASRVLHVPQTRAQLTNRIAGRAADLGNRMELVRDARAAGYADVADALGAELAPEARAVSDLRRLSKSRRKVPAMESLTVALAALPELERKQRNYAIVCALDIASRLATRDVPNVLVAVSTALRRNDTLTYDRAWISRQIVEHIAEGRLERPDSLLQHALVLDMAEVAQLLNPPANVPERPADVD